MASMIDMNPAASAAYMMKMLFDLLVRVCIAFTVIAFGDYLYQRWEYEKELRMTKQEVKDEYKQTEGNPEIKNQDQKPAASDGIQQDDAEGSPGRCDHTKSYPCGHCFKTMIRIMTMLR